MKTEKKQNNADIEGVKEYERVRRYLEHMYLYGFLNRDRFSEVKGYSKKDYDKMLRLINDILPNDITNEEGKKCRRVKRNYGSDSKSLITNSYMLRSIKTETYLLSYLLILSALSSSSDMPFNMDFLYENFQTLPGFAEKRLQSEAMEMAANAMENIKNGAQHISKIITDPVLEVIRRLSDIEKKAETAKRSKTSSANYAKIISEIENISEGYSRLLPKIREAFSCGNYDETAKLYIQFKKEILLAGINAIIEKYKKINNSQYINKYITSLKKITAENKQIFTADGIDCLINSCHIDHRTESSTSHACTSHACTLDSSASFDSQDKFDVSTEFDVPEILRELKRIKEMERQTRTGCTVDGERNGQNAQNKETRELFKEFYETEDIIRRIESIDETRVRSALMQKTEELELLKRSVEQGIADIEEIKNSLDNVRRCGEISRTWETFSEKLIKQNRTNWKNVVQNCRNKIKDLEDAGYIRQSDKPKESESKENDNYILANADFFRIYDSTLKQLYDYVCFVSEISYPKVAGSFLRRTLEREMFRRNLFRDNAGKSKTDSLPSYFIIRNNSAHNVFDEDLVYRFFDAISAVTEDGENGKIKNSKSVKVNGKDFIPMGLRPDVRFGRWFVWGATEYNNRLSFTVYPISNVQCLEVTDEEKADKWNVENFDDEIQRIRKISQKVMYSGRRNNMQTVEADLLFGNAPQDKEAEEQFYREKFFGTVSCRDGHLKYTAKIIDPTELHPWIRSFSPWLQVISTPGQNDKNLGRERNEQPLSQTLRESLGAMKDALTLQKYSAAQPRNYITEKYSGKQEQVLFNRFQSREMQFSLELLCRLKCCPLSVREVKNIAEKDFGLKPDVCEKLLDQLSEYDFLRQDKRTYYPGNTPMPLMAPDKIETDYLQYILSLPDADLFLDDVSKRQLSLLGASLGSSASPSTSSDETENVLPRWNKYIERFTPQGGSVLPKTGFGLLLRAIKDHSMICCGTSEKDGLKKIFPWKLEYSAFDRCWWLLAYDINTKSIERIFLGEHVHIMEAGAPPIPYGEIQKEIPVALEKHRYKGIRLHITDRYNALKRCFLMFENEEITASKYISDGEYEMVFDTMDYYKTEIVRKLMYLGENVVLTEGPAGLKEELLEKIEQALRNNRET